MQEDIIIPVTMFIGLTIVFSLYYWFRYRSRLDMQETVRLALDKGHELSPEMIDRLGHPKAPGDRDLRLGMIWMSLAVGLALCGLAIPDMGFDTMRSILAGAAFPFAIGSAYLILWTISRRS